VSPPRSVAHWIGGCRGEEKGAARHGQKAADKRTRPGGRCPTFSWVSPSHPPVSDAGPFGGSFVQPADATFRFFGCCPTVIRALLISSTGSGATLHGGDDGNDKLQFSLKFLQ
jgi:hypothetical protein